MSEMIKTGKFVIVKDKKYFKVNDDNSSSWTLDIKEAERFESEKLAVMYKYASDIGECNIIELVNKSKQK